MVFSTHPSLTLALQTETIPHISDGGRDHSSKQYGAGTRPLPLA